MNPFHLKIDIDMARAAISRIRQLDLRIASIEEIKNLLFPCFRGLRICAPRFDPGLRVFRSRKCAKPLNILDIGCPPAALVRMGRVNRAGEPVFYCATSRETAVFEAQPTPGDMLAIGRWIATKSIRANHVGYSPTVFETLGSARPTISWESDRGPALDNASQEIGAFLSEAFSSRVARGEEHLYKLTVAISEKLLHGGTFDGLIYPTIQMRGNADNFALKTEFADTGLRFEAIEFLRIDRAHGFSFDVTVIDTATRLANGKFLWKGRQEQWVIPPGQMLRMCSEGGIWLARDAAGNVVEPA